MKSGPARCALIRPSSNTQSVFITTLHSGTMTTHHGDLGRPAAISTATPETTGDQPAASSRRGHWADGAHRNSPGVLIEFPHPGRVSL
jgi:hypothetical protein